MVMLNGVQVPSREGGQETGVG